MNGHETLGIHCSRECPQIGGRRVATRVKVHGAAACVGKPLIDESAIFVFQIATPHRPRPGIVGRWHDPLACVWKCCNFENGDGGHPERSWAARFQAARSNSWSM